MTLVIIYKSARRSDRAGALHLHPLGADHVSRLGKMPSRLPPAPTRLKLGTTEQPRLLRDFAQWRKWYNTKEWRAIRWAVLVDALFTCCRCGRVEGDTSQLVADHVIPHRGDRALFFDPDNLQCLCARCHNSAKQAEERAAMGREGG